MFRKYITVQQVGLPEYTEYVYRASIVITTDTHTESKGVYGATKDKALTKLFTSFACGGLEIEYLPPSKSVKFPEATWTDGEKVETDEDGKVVVKDLPKSASLALALMIATLLVLVVLLPDARETQVMNPHVVFVGEGE